MIGPEVPQAEVVRREANRSLQEKKQKRALTKSALVVVNQFDAQVAERIGFESEGTIFEEMRKDGRARDSKVKAFTFIRGNMDIFFYQGNPYQEYRIEYSRPVQEVRIRTKDASFEVRLEKGTVHKLSAALYEHNYLRKGVTMGMNGESDAFLAISQEDRTRNVGIDPLQYEITESGDLAVAEMQGVYERHGRPVSVDLDEKANKTVITCAERNFEYPLIINPEELFVDFEEELKF